MRVVRTVDEVAEAVERARSEAATAFGNGDVYVERLVERARHIEVQIVGDDDGSVLSFGDRDCSIQRRHQKLIEIAPAPGARRRGPRRTRRRRRAHGPRRRLPQPRHVRVPRRDRRRRRRAVRVHRGQRPAAGRAHRHRGGHRRRPRPAPARAGPGRDAGRPRLTPGDRAGAARRRHPGAGQPGDDAARRVDAAVGRRAHRVRAAGRAGPPHRHVRLRRLRHDSPASTRCWPRWSPRRPSRTSPHAARRVVDRHWASSASRAWRPTSPSCRPCCSTRTSSTRPPTRGSSTSTSASCSTPRRQHPRPFAPVRRGGARAAPACAWSRPTRWRCSTTASPEPRPRRRGAGPAELDLPSGTVAIRAPMQGTIVSIQIVAGDEVVAGRQVLVMEAMKMEHVVSAPVERRGRPADRRARRHRVRGARARSSSRRPTSPRRTPAGDDEIDLDHVRPDLAEVIDRHLSRSTRPAPTPSPSAAGPTSARRGRTSTTSATRARSSSTASSSSRPAPACRATR